MLKAIDTVWRERKSGLVEGFDFGKRVIAALVAALAYAAALGCMYQRHHKHQA